MIDKPRGTRDFLPEEMEKRRRLEERMRAVFERYGYEEVATPALEHLDLFTLKSGEGIIEETYAFEDKAGRKLALRPELTAPVMRMYVANLQMEAKPLKLYYFGNCFRYDRPQKGRYREFWQFGCELIGTERSEGLAELIALAYEVLKESGLKQLILRIGNLDILRRFLDGIGARDAEILRLIDKKDFETLRTRMAEKDFNEFMKFISIKNLDDIPYEEVQGMKEILSFLKELAVPCNIDLSIARGLDYYTGTVFEIDAPKLGAEKQLCGGGTYNLVPLLGGKNIPTSGFAIGFDRTLVALEAEGYAFAQGAKPVYVAYMQGMVREALRVAKILRKNGIKTDIDLMGRNMKKSLEYADRRGMKTAVIVAPDEWEKGCVVVKDMQKGEQQEVALDDISSFLKQHHL